MTVVGKINTYEFNALKQKACDDAHKMCRKDRRSAAIVGAALGLELGLALMFFIGGSIVGWIEAALIPATFAIAGAASVYANQCAEKSEEDYLVYPASYKYYRATDGKTVLKESCYVYDDYGRLYVTAVGPNGIVEDFNALELGVARKVGIDDTIVDLSEGMIYVPYANE